jgi:hypothetical protein
MHGIEAFGLAAREAYRLDRGNFESGFVNPRENFTAQAPPYCIRFDNCQRTFDCHSGALHIVGFLDENNL